MCIESFNDVFDFCIAAISFECGTSAIYVILLVVLTCTILLEVSLDAVVEEPDESSNFAGNNVLFASMF